MGGMGVGYEGEGGVEREIGRGVKGRGGGR